jgi:nicotinamide riboside kinase
LKKSSEKRNDLYGAYKRPLVLVAKDLFDLHIRCSPDIPGEVDPLREKPNTGNQLSELYKASLIRYNKNFIIVLSTLKNRFEQCLQNIGLLQNK